MFLQVNLDKKEFNAEQAEPEVIITPLDSELADAANNEEVNSTQLGGRCVDFFAAPYMLKLKLNEDLVPAMLTKDGEGKEIVWQRWYGAYLIKLRKVNYG